MVYVRARGTRFHVVELGADTGLPPVVMLHGLFTGSAASWYFTAAPAIARFRAVRLIDWRGHGLSERTATGYATEHPLGRIVAERCKQAGVPLVKLGVVDDGNPNAFTFGHTRGDARIWITRGLLERLDERELNAVVAHEVGHVKNRDFIVMTVAAVVPMVLYLIYVVGTRAGRNETRSVASENSSCTRGAAANARAMASA